MIRPLLLSGLLSVIIAAPAVAQSAGAPAAPPKSAAHKRKAHQPKPPPVNTDHNSDPTIKPATAPR